jgi:N-acetylglucosaminyldiphosphoundecaprenol N-acetyl-beta-D-mannosaminyltransferase
MDQRVVVLGTPIDNLNMTETLDCIIGAIRGHRHLHHTVVNAGKIVNMQKDAQLRESVVNADIINADGQGVVWASRILGKPLKERVAGIDLMEQLVRVAYLDGYKVFFLGAKEDIVRSVVEHYSEIYSSGVIAGYRNGYFKKEDEPEIARQIAASGANILFVAISSPTKENFLYQHRDVLKKVNFIMGVGGSFDVVSGLVKRAPLWMQKAGLEWLFRVYQEPRRMFKRYLVGNLKFIALVMKHRLRHLGSNDAVDSFGSLQPKMPAIPPSQPSFERSGQKML